jgi:2'-5' RNA ligase
MYRLFVAVELPDEVKNRLVRLRADIPGASWTKPNAMHLTLRFLGDGLSEDQLAAIRGALESIRAAPFELKMQGVGKFPQGARPARVLWSGVAPSKALMTLQSGVERAVESVGFAPERDFSAHITLARLKQPRPSAEVQRFLAAHADFACTPFPVDEFILFSSQLTPQGSIYTRQGVYRLE